MDIDTIRALWLAGDVVYSEDAQDRLWQREVTMENVGEALLSGSIVEERKGRPYRKCTVQGWANRKAAGLEIGLHLLNVSCAVGDELHYWK